MTDTRIQQIADQMIRFKSDTLKLVERRGRLYQADDLVLEPAEDEKVVEAQSLKDIQGVSYFTLGAVYVAARVPYSFLDQYRAEVGDTHFMTFELPSPWAQSLDVVDEVTGQTVGTWGDKIHALPTEDLDALSAFMTEQILVREQVAYGINFYDMLIHDPVLRSKGVPPTPSTRIPVRVFSAYTRRYGFKPVEDIRSSEILFTRYPTPQNLATKLNAVMAARQTTVTPG